MKRFFSTKDALSLSDTLKDNEFQAAVDAKYSPFGPSRQLFSCQCDRQGSVQVSQITIS